MYRDEENNCIGFLFNGFYSRFFARRSKGDKVKDEENYHEIISSLLNNVQLVVVSKTHSSNRIQEIYHEGQRIFGENKVQELVERQKKIILYYKILNIKFTLERINL